MKRSEVAGTVVITGAANGLGKALAIEYYREGFALALIDINLDGLIELKKLLKPAGKMISIHKADVSVEEEVVNVKKTIAEQHTNIDILINNAAISMSQPFDQLTLADFRRLLDVNFWGMVYCTRYFLPALKQSKEARIVNIISGFATMGFPGKTTYAASKAAILGFTNSLKTELEGTSIRPCLVIPPPIDTGLVKNNKHIDENKKQLEINFIQKRAMRVNKVAARIVQQVKKGKYRIIIGSMMFWMDVGSRFFPTILHKMIGRSKKKIEFY